MKKILLLSLVYFVFGCATKKESTYLLKYKQNFKEAAYCDCVFYGYYDMNKASKKIFYLDKSFENSIVYTLSGDIIHTIVNEQTRIMKKDSLESIEAKAENIAGKRVLSHCLKFYQSKKLDYIAQKEYKRLKKQSKAKLDTLISQKLPAY
jgi:hypothetical protein